MADILLTMEHVSKKFKRGESHDSLRDLIPALFAGYFKRSRDIPLAGGEFWAVRDASFLVGRGEALGIIGSNGAGKSTILKLLTGVLKPTEGVVRTSGVMSALIEVGAGFHPDLTGRENIFLNGTILGMRKEQIKRKFDEIVDFSGLADFIDTPVKRYSSGMYARLGFSVAAHVDPDILVVDEVLSVGDNAFQRKCMERMKSIVNKGVTVVFVSHNLRAVAGICRSCILLDHGSIVRVGVPEEVIGYYQDGDRDEQQESVDAEVFISKTAFRGVNGETLQFESGQKGVFEIEIAGRSRCEKLSAVVGVFDDNNYEVFNTSTERLKLKPFSLGEGERKRVTFELNLHLAPGTYHVGAYIYRYDIQRTYDSRPRAQTIYVVSDRDVRGVVDLQPTAIVA